MAQESISFQEIPDGNEKPWISLSYTGGFRRPPIPDFEPTPLVRIFPNGRLITGGATPAQVVAEMQLSESQMTEIYLAILKKSRLLEIEQSELELELQGDLDGMIMDAATTVLEIRRPETTHQWQVYASTFNLNRHPNLPLLGRFCKVENLLRRYYSLAQIGSQEQLDELLGKINQHFAADERKIPEFTADHLNWFSRNKNGNLTAIFHQLMEATNDSEEKMWVLNYSWINENEDFHLAERIRR